MKRIKSYELFLKENRFPADDEQVESQPCVKCDCEDCSQCDCEKCDCPKCCAEDKDEVFIAKPGYYGKTRKVVDDEVVESNKKFEFFHFGNLKNKGLTLIERKLLYCIMDMNYDEILTKEDILSNCCLDENRKDVESALSGLESKSLIHYDSDLNDYKPTQAGFKMWKDLENMSEVDNHKRKSAMAQSGIDVSNKPKHTYRTPGPKP